MRQFISGAALFGLVFGVAVARGGEGAPKAPLPEAETVDLFTAMEAGQIAARVIPKDETRVRLQLKNEAGKPLNVRLPAVLAAVPVLAQAGGGFNAGFGGQPGGGGLLGGANPGGNQALGIGGGGNAFGNPGFGNGFQAGGPGGGRNNGFPGGAIFNVPEGRITKIDLPAACLEYGKRNPAPRIPYELRPLEQLSSDPLLAALLTALDDRRVERETVQLAVWRVTSGWTWDEMRTATTRRPWGAVEPRFDADRLEAARKLTERIAKQNSATVVASTVHGQTGSGN